MKKTAQHFPANGKYVVPETRIIRINPEGFLADSKLKGFNDGDFLYLEDENHVNIW